VIGKLLLQGAECKGTLKWKLRYIRQNVEYWRRDLEFNMS